MVSTRNNSNISLKKTYNKKKSFTQKHPYNINGNIFKDKMNNLFINGIKNVFINPLKRILVLDGKNNRTSKALIKSGICKKENIESVEFDKQTYNDHLKFGIKSNFNNLEDFVNIKNKIPYQAFCCDSIGNVQTCGNIILDAIRNNILSDNSFFLVTFSKRGKLFGEIFLEELYKWYRKLENLLESKNLYLLEIPNIEKTIFEYAGREQSAMFSEIFLIGSDISKKRIIPYPKNFDIPEKILAHKGTVNKKNKLRFLTKWENDNELTLEPWINLKNCEVFHHYLKMNNLKKLIPDLYK